MSGLDDPVYDTQSGAIFVHPFAFLGAIDHSDLTSVNDPRLQYKNIYVLVKNPHL